MRKRGLFAAFLGGVVLVPAFAWCAGGCVDFDFDAVSFRVEGTNTIYLNARSRSEADPYKRGPEIARIELGCDLTKIKDDDFDGAFVGYIFSAVRRHKYFTGSSIVCEGQTLKTVSRKNESFECPITKIAVK